MVYWTNKGYNGIGKLIPMLSLSIKLKDDWLLVTTYAIISYQTKGKKLQYKDILVTLLSKEKAFFLRGKKKIELQNNTIDN